MVEPQDPEAMAQAVIQMENPEVRRVMGEAGRVAAVTQYDRKLVLKELEHRLQEIVTERRKLSAGQIADG